MNATATNNVATALLRKITMSEVFGLARKSGGFKPVRDFGAKVDSETGLVQPFDPFLICRVVGVVRGAKAEKTDYGDYIEFSGNFGATNAKGKTFRAPKCILPEPAQSLLNDALESSIANGGSAVELAFDFHAVPDAGDRGYKYQVTPLMQQPEDDPIERLQRDMNSQYALPAPTANVPDAPKEDAPQAEKGATKKK